MLICYILKIYSLVWHTTQTNIYTSFLSIKCSFSLWIKEFLHLWSKVIIHCTSKWNNIVVLGWLYRPHGISYNKSTEIINTENKQKSCTKCNRHKNFKQNIAVLLFSIVLCVLLYYWATKMMTSLHPNSTLISSAVLKGSWSWPTQTTRVAQATSYALRGSIKA